MRRAVVTVVTVVTLAACGGAPFSSADFAPPVDDDGGPTDGGAVTGPDGALDVGPDATDGGQGGTDVGTDAKQADAGPTPGPDAPAVSDAGMVDAMAVDVDGGRVPTDAGGSEGGEAGAVDAIDAGAVVDGGAIDARPPTCGPGTCSGCCMPTGECVTGDSVIACGIAGGACNVCPWRCQFGTPWACGADAGESSEAFAPVCKAGSCDTEGAPVCCGHAANRCDSTGGCL